MEQSVILCVEDDERNRIQIRRKFSSRFKLLYFAKSGEEARCFINELRPDFIMSGAQMKALGDEDVDETILNFGAIGNCVIPGYVYDYAHANEDVDQSYIVPCSEGYCLLH